MADKSIDVYRKAENHLLENSPEEALAGFLAVAKSDPNHTWVRFKIGSTLEQLKQPNRAFELYKSLAWHCIKAGYPLLGLVAIKRAVGIQAMFEGALNALADLYSLESERIQPSLELFEPPGLDEGATVEALDIAPDKVAATAVQVAADFPDARYPSELPAIPLFSLLTAETFYPILEILQLQTYAPGETIVQQGDPCSSIYMLAHGEVEVAEEHHGERHTLARLVSGSVFGEMALITDAPRVASAIAIRESEILQLRREDLELAAEDLDDITWALAKFTRQRFIQHLLLTSSIFAPFSPQDRREIFERFSSIGVPTGDVIIEEGTVGPGLYIILGGEVEISKLDGDSRVHLTRLSEGSVFGEISLVNKSPTTATVQAVRGGEFLFLSRDDFQELIEERPEIHETLAALSAERIEQQRKTVADAGVTSADGSILF